MMNGFPLPILPHRMLSNPTIFDPLNQAENALSIALQKQVAGFFNSGGHSQPNPNTSLTGTVFSGQTLFEILSVLPEQLNFIQIPR